MRTYMRRGLRGLEPLDEATTQALAKIPVGDIVRVDYARPRNVAHHRKFFALLRVVRQATGQWESEDELLLELKLRLGIVKDYVLIGTGEVYKIPGSINFASMGQDEFEAFYERAVEKLCEMAGGIESVELRDAVLDELA